MAGSCETRMKRFYTITEATAIGFVNEATGADRELRLPVKIFRT